MTSAAHTRARQEIDQHRLRIADEVVKRCFAEKPELDARYGPIGRKKCHEDTIYHLRYLADAVGTNSPSLFVDYIGWAKVLLAGYNIPEKDLINNLELLREVLANHLTVESQAAANASIEQALLALPKQPTELACLLLPEDPHHFLAKEYLARLLEGNRRESTALIMKAVEGGVSLKDLYLHVFEPTQHEVGRLWQSNKISVAQEHFCTASTQVVMSQLYSRLFSSARAGKTLVATSVGGELHEIGIRMVADFFELEGWDTYYLGANTPAHSLVKMASDMKADVVAISATMTYHVGEVEKMIAALRKNPATNHVKIMVGGYPFNIDRDLWKKSARMPPQLPPAT